MSKISNKLREDLITKFGDRANFQRLERKLYGHDIASIPSLVKLIVGKTIPEAVVQPRTEEELIWLVNWAKKNRVSITPRGAASSGYGGVIPVKRGIVIDFYRMQAIKKIDAKNNTATVEAGIVWEKLDKELMRHGLTLRLYPSSYPSATVGGWLAQGGAGFGSYEMGWFRENVVKARVITPNGEAREFTGDDLDLIYEAEGITGLISEVTISVKPFEEMDVVAIGCPDVNDLQKTIQSIIDNELPIWSMVFINPRMAEMKNNTPLMEHLGHPSEERILLPASYVMTLTCRRKDFNIVKDKLTEIVKVCEAEILSDRIAQHEWDNRFKLMLVKRLGPSLVPTEIVIPLKQLGNVINDIGEIIEQPVVKEGLIIRNGRNNEPEVVILGFIPGDQRRFEYNWLFGLVISIMTIAEKHGGRPYSTGMYFTNKAKKVFGEDTIHRIKQFSQEHDSKRIFNPGKVIGSGVLGTLMVLAAAVEPVLRILGNRITTHVGERPAGPVRDIPADVAWYAYACSQCGYCVHECDQFYGRGWESQSPRGKWYWLREYMEGREEWDQFMVDTMIACTTCELCNLRCSASLPIEPAWMKLRGQLIDEEKRMTFPPFEMMAASLRKEGDIWAAYRKDRDKWFPEDLLEKHGPAHKSKTAYFAGCTASHVETDIALATVRLLDAAGIDFTYLGKKDNCCGTPMLVCGKWDVFAEVMKENIQNMKEAGVDTVISSCPACDMMWRHIYPKWAKQLDIDFNIEAKHYSEVVAERISAEKFSIPDTGRKTKVTLHDSCHIARVSGVYDAPRELIKAIPGVDLVEMEHNREWAHCCGSVLTLIKDPKIAAEIGQKRMDEAIATGAEKLIALCPCCEFQFRVTAEKKDIAIETIDLARFTASALGYEFHDPNPEVMRQWAVFEKMIALMSPEGFAQLMSTMWPELIDAMPFNMGGMMRAMGKIPGLLNLMRPFFPILFPKLLPKMMPELLPVMMKRIDDQIEMPDYMREQMPELMPKIMDNLMPHMIGDVVPLVVTPVIDYLEGNRSE